MKKNMASKDLSRDFPQSLLKALFHQRLPLVKPQAHK